MSYGPKQVFSDTIASGASTSGGIQLGTKSYSQVYVRYVTMSTGAELTLQTSLDGSTYFNVFERVNTAPVQYQVVTVATGVSGTGVAPIPVPGTYVRFVASAVVSGGVALSVITHD
jgi:hypothetical protein